MALPRPDRRLPRFPLPRLPASPFTLAIVTGILWLTVFAETPPPSLGDRLAVAGDLALGLLCLGAWLRYPKGNPKP